MKDFWIRLDLRYRFNRRVEKTQMWIVWHLPRWMVYWATFRLLAHATTGKYGTTHVPELTAMDAVDRWDK